MAMENPPFMDDFPQETSICSGFAIAMFDHRRVRFLLDIESQHVEILDAQMLGHLPCLEYGAPSNKNVGTKWHTHIYIYIIAGILAWFKLIDPKYDAFGS